MSDTIASHIDLNASAVRAAGRTIAINNRRYLGNKYRLLPFIRRVVSEQCEGIGVLADLFAGTGAVSSAFPEYVLITNDLLYSNYISNLAWFGAEAYDLDKVREYILRYNAAQVGEDNYMSDNFSDTYFCRDDCRRIGFVREDIERNYRSGALNDRERALLITALIYAMDRIAKTCGHYDAYRRCAEFDAHLTLCVPEASNRNHPANRQYNGDANQLVRAIRADLVYLDPPYNSRQYGDCYHLLENVARWEKPQVFGVARKMDRTHLKSDYCTGEAPAAFSDLIRHTDARYILLSYNNTGHKAHGRSNAKLTDEEILDVLSSKGRVEIFSQAHRAFSAGLSRNTDNSERLFLCHC